MKKYILILSAVIFATGIYAQHDTAPGQGHKNKQDKHGDQGDRDHEARESKHFDELRSALDLSEAQTTQLKSIQDKYKAERRSIKESNREQKDAMKTQLKALNERQMAEIDGILSDDQRMKYTAYIDEKQKQRQQKRMQDRKQDGQQDPKQGGQSDGQMMPKK